MERAITASIPSTNQDNNEDADFNMKLFPLISFEEYVPTIIERAAIERKQKEKLLSNLQLYFKVNNQSVNESSGEDSESNGNVLYTYLEALFSPDLFDISNRNYVYKTLTCKYLIHRHYREQFLEFVNLKRGKTTDIKSEEVFNMLQKVFDFLFAQMTVTNEYANIRNLLLLSQSFYHLNALANRKTFIEDGLKTNVKLCNEEYWIQYIEQAIEEETHNGEPCAFYPLLVNIINVVDFVKCETKVMHVIDYFFEKYAYSATERENILEEVNNNLMLLD